MRRKVTKAGGAKKSKQVKRGERDTRLRTSSLL